MTENFLERIENALNDIENIQTLFKARYGEECLADKEIAEVLKIAKAEHEELEQYRSIVTVEYFKQLSEQFKPHTIDETSCKKRMCNKCDKYRKENEEYHKIGTASECREAVEKQRAKKLIKYGDTRQGLDNSGISISWQEDCYECPNCESFIGYVSDCKDEHYQDSYCRNCGQSILYESDNE